MAKFPENVIKINRKLRIKNGRRYCLRVRFEIDSLRVYSSAVVCKLKRNKKNVTFNEKKFKRNDLKNFREISYLSEMAKSSPRQFELLLRKFSITCKAFFSLAFCKYQYGESCRNSRPGNMAKGIKAPKIAT